MTRRALEEKLARAVMLAATAIVVGSLGLILATIVAKGAPALSVEMLTQVPKGGYAMGGGGGILNAILGSLLLGGLATSLAAAVSLPVALYLNVFRRRESRIATLVRFFLDVLWGVPSIVYGALAFTVMVVFRVPASLLAGAFTIALLIMPIMARAMDEVLRMIPFELHEAALSLGTTRLEVALRVVLRQGLPGLVTAVLIAFGRGIGDAAAVLFTAGFTDALPGSLTKPVATLPLAIFFQLGTPFPEVQARGYAAAVVLTAMLLAISVGARALTRAAGRNVVR